MESIAEDEGEPQDNDSTETKEPDILSSDPNERKLARRMRIQRRLEVLNKPQVEEDEDEIEDVEKTLLEEQIENSAEQLEKLLLEGKELVTNVRVANDAREVQRREVEVGAREERLQKLEEEAALSLEKFEEINAKWQKVADSKDPLHMHQQMEEQKVKCLELIAQKNAMIEELRKELMVADERFNKDQEKQKADLALVVERIDNQVNLMRKAYRQELKLIEQAIGTERKQQLDAAARRWEHLYKEREKEEVSNMNKKFEQVAEFEDEMHQINVEYQEKMRETKIKLETDIQVLQQELEQVKALCLLNSEKLDYNYQVLKKRDEENLLIKAQQKRRLNKLQDVVNALKKKINEVQSHTGTEQARLTAEVIRLHTNIVDIEKKADHFAEVNDKTYHQVWDMNRQNATKLLEKILTTDRLIHEQQLGMEWIPPDKTLLQAEEMESYRSAMKVVEDLFTGTQKEVNPNVHYVASEALQQEESAFTTLVPECSSVEDLTETRIKRRLAEQRLLRHILALIADNSGFLLEERLHAVLKPYTKKQQMLIKIDNVFSALGVKREADMMLLKTFFLPYAHCAMCEKAEAKFNETYNTPEMEVKSVVLYKSDDGSETSVSSRSGSGMISRETLDDHEEAGHQKLLYSLSEGVEIQRSMADTLATSIASTGVITISTVRFESQSRQAEEDHTNTFGSEPAVRAPSSSSKRFKPKCSPDHSPTIDPIYVLRAVRDFMTYFTQDKEGVIVNMNTRLAKKRSTISRLLVKEDVQTFWIRFREIFSPEREKLWDGLLMALHKYHAILEDRQKLNAETEQLRSQNAELRRLLQSYMESEQAGQGSRSPRRASPTNRKPYRTPGHARNPNKKCNCHFKCYCKC